MTSRRLNPSLYPSAPPGGSRSLTADERLAMGALHNLADAHTYHAMSEQENSAILKRFPEIFEASLASEYRDLEVLSCGEFLASMGQSLNHDRLIATYSASVSILVAARALRIGNRTTASLTSPTFDNIEALLVAEGLSVRAHQPGSEREAVLPGGRGVIVSVSPNNPSGEWLDELEVARLARHCRQRDYVLVLDQSFKAHDARACFDHHRILEDAGVSYVVIEDTGKLWPVRDLKASFIVTSGDMFDCVREVADDVLLNVAPFVLELIRELARLSAVDGFESLRSTIAANRAALRSALSVFGPHVEIPFGGSRVGVELLCVPGLKPEALMHAAGSRQLGVLDARKFYWAGPSPKGAVLRVALCREPDLFRLGVAELVGALRWLLFERAEE